MSLYRPHLTVTMTAHRKGESERRRRRSAGSTSPSTLTTVVVLLLAMTSSRSSDACTMMNQFQLDCLTSGQTMITINCLDNFQVRILTATVYQLPTTSCPSTITNNTTSTACQQTNQTTAIRCLTSTSRCSFSPSFGNSTSSCTGAYLVATTYRCMPTFRGPTDRLPSTGSSVTISSNATVLNAGISIGSGLNPSNDTTHYFSIHVPAGVELVISVTIFSTSGASSTSCNSRVEVIDVNNQTVAQFCKYPSPSVSLGCGDGPSPRYFLARYVTGSPVAQSIYALQLTVPQTSKLMAQGGTPPFPLIAPADTALTVSTLVSTQFQSSALWTTAGRVSTTPVPSESTTVGPVRTTSIPAMTTAVPVVMTTSLPVASASVNVSSSSATDSSLTSISNMNITMTTAGGQDVAGTNGLSQSAVIAIIVGCSLAGTIILLAVVIGACYSYRSTVKTPNPTAVKSPAQATQYMAEPPPRTANYQLDPRSNNRSPFRNITEFYVDGNTASKLVLNRQKEPQFFKTVIRV